MKVVAVVLEPAEVERLCASLGEATEAPRLVEAEAGEDGVVRDERQEEQPRLVHPLDAVAVRADKEAVQQQELLAIEEQPHDGPLPPEGTPAAA